MVDVYMVNVGKIYNTWILWVGNGMFFPPFTPRKTNMTLEQIIYFFIGGVYTDLQNGCVLDLFSWQIFRIVPNLPK